MTPDDGRTAGGGFAPLFFAWLVALGATLGALFVGEVMGQAPCVLCWYQRIAMFPLAVILGIACLRADTAIHWYALPFVVIGAGFAVWHVLVYFDAIPTAIEPCTQGASCRGGDMTILGGMPLPLLSLGAFVAIGTLLVVAKWRESRE